MMPAVLITTTDTLHSKDRRYTTSLKPEILNEYRLHHAVTKINQVHRITRQTPLKICQTAKDLTIRGLPSITPVLQLLEQNQTNQQTRGLSRKTFDTQKCMFRVKLVKKVCIEESSLRLFIRLSRHFCPPHALSFRTVFHRFTAFTGQKPLHFELFVHLLQHSIF